MIKSLSEDKLRTYGGHKRGSGKSSCTDQVQPLPLEGDIQESCAYAPPHHPRGSKQALLASHLVFLECIFSPCWVFLYNLFSAKAHASLSRSWVTLNKEVCFSLTLFLVPFLNHVLVGRSVGPGEQCWCLDLWRGGVCKFGQLQGGGRDQPVGYREGDEGFPAPHSQS